MSARKNRLRDYFAAESELDAAVKNAKAELERQFAGLKEASLAGELLDAGNLGLQGRLIQAANEAAGLAWNSGYPLLVFPALFDELARRERAREARQQRIRARSEMLLHETATV